MSWFLDFPFGSYAWHWWYDVDVEGLLDIIAPKIAV